MTNLLYLIAILLTVSHVLLGYKLYRVAIHAHDVSIQLERTLNRHADQDKALDYVLRMFNLHVPDPYVDRPAYDEKRCYHCHIPQGFRHADDCPWLLLRPLVLKLYPTKQAPLTSLAAPIPEK